MTEKVFYEMVREEAAKSFAQRYPNTELTLREVTKNNGLVLTGLTVREGESNISPMLYLNDYYQEHRQGKPVEEIVRNLMAAYENSKDQMVSLNPEQMDFSYEKIKDRLRVRLFYERDNKELLKDSLSAPVGCGYVLAAYMELPMSSGPTGMIRISRQMADHYGYDKAQLMKDALAGSVKNDQALLNWLDMEQIMRGRIPSENLLEKQELGELRFLMLILTNQDKHLGSSVLFYPDIQHRIGELVGGDYFVLPSSIHEVLILPDKGNMNTRDLVEMVKAVNESQVKREEQLGNRVMHYRADQDRLSVAEDLDREADKGRKGR